MKRHGIFHAFTLLLCSLGAEAQLGEPPCVVKEGSPQEESYGAYKEGIRKNWAEEEAEGDLKLAQAKAAVRAAEGAFVLPTQQKMASTRRSFRLQGRSDESTSEILDDDDEESEEESSAVSSFSGSQGRLLSGANGVVLAEVQVKKPHLRQKPFVVWESDSFHDEVGGLDPEDDEGKDADAWKVQEGSKKEDKASNRIEELNAELDAEASFAKEAELATQAASQEASQQQAQENSMGEGMSEEEAESPLNQEDVAKLVADTKQQMGPAWDKKKKKLDVNGADSCGGKAGKVEDGGFAKGADVAVPQEVSTDLEMDASSKAEATELAAVAKLKAEDEAQVDKETREAVSLEAQYSGEALAEAGNMGSQKARDNLMNLKKKLEGKAKQAEDDERKRQKLLKLEAKGKEAKLNAMNLQAAAAVEGAVQKKLAKMAAKEDKAKADLALATAKENARTPMTDLQELVGQGEKQIAKIERNFLTAAYKQSYETFEKKQAGLPAPSLQEINNLVSEGEETIRNMKKNLYRAGFQKAAEIVMNDRASASPPGTA